MNKLSQKLKKISTLKIAFVLFVALQISCCAVSGVFARYQTSFTYTGTTPVTEWGFDLKVNNKLASSSSVVANLDLATKYEESEDDVVKGSNTDVNKMLKAGKVAPGSAGYVSVELNAVDTEVSFVITVEATFLNLPDGMVFTDNLGRTLEKETGITGFVPKDTTVKTAYQDSSDSSYTGTATQVSYTYYLSYDELAQWYDCSLSDKFIDIGFRWKWVTDDDVDNDFNNKNIYSEVYVSCEQAIDESNIPLDTTVLNFATTVADTADSESGLRYGDDILNIALADLCGDADSCTINPTDDLYLDISCLTRNSIDLSGKDYNVQVAEDNDEAVENIVLGTFRREKEYADEDDRPTATVQKGTDDGETVSAYTLVSNDYQYTYSGVQAYNLRSENIVDALNTLLINKKISEATPYDTLDAIMDKKGSGSALDAFFDTTDYTLDDVEKLIADSGDNVHFIVWDTASRKFIYMEDGSFVKTQTTKSIEDVGADYTLFRFYSTDKADVTAIGTGDTELNVSQTYSVYLAGTVTGVINNLTTGIDVGENNGITSITYDRHSASTSQSVIIRTASANTGLTVNAPLDTVSHYSTAGYVGIVAVQTSSYHEYGNVPVLEIAKGRVVLEEASDVDQIHIDAKKDDGGNSTNTFDEIIVSVTKEVTIPTFSRDPIDISTIDEEGTLVLEIEKGNNQSDFVYLFQQGLAEQIKVTTGESTTVNNAEAKAIDSTAVNGSNTEGNTSSIVQDIANNLNGSYADVAKDADGNVTDTGLITDTGLDEGDLEDLIENKQQEAVSEEQTNEYKDAYYWIGNKADSFEGNHLGTVDDPYQIKTAQQLALLAYNVNNAVEAPAGHTAYASASYLLIADIDLTDLTWDPIGNIDNPFSGNFSGKYDTDQSHKITGLNDTNFMLESNNEVRTTYTNSEGYFYGLFGIIGTATGAGSTQTFEYVELKDVSINCSDGVIVGGFIASDTKAAKKQTGVSTDSTINSSFAGNITIDHVTVSGTITSTTDKSTESCTIAGIIGKSYSSGTLTVTNCVCSATLTAQDEKANKGAGLIGYSKNTVALSNNEFSGTFNCSSWMVGGIVCGEIAGGYVNNNTFSGTIKTGHPNGIDNPATCPAYGSAIVYATITFTHSGNSKTAESKVYYMIDTTEYTTEQLFGQNGGSGATSD